MKVLLCVLVISFACVSGLPTPKEEIHIVRQNQEENDHGYRFFYEQTDGQKREEEASLVQSKGNEPVLVVRGSYSYIGPDGVEYKVTYVADENGFQPIEDHFQVPELNIPDVPVIDTLPPPVALPPNAINSLIG